ncbi:MAG: hypothetical protein COA70_01770 [Planctomycetota bacterium]|nr:MAG: hypothetical protein COA70_01770 [Planctomycetota bacterium]
MKRLPLLISLCVLLGTAACSSAGVENGPLSGSARFVGDDKIDDIIERSTERISFGRSDFAVYQVELQNQDEDDVQVEYRARWFDADGIEVQSVTRSWKKLFIAGRSYQPVTSTAPNMEAIRCEVEVRLSEY